MIPFLKKNKDGKKPPKSTVPHTAQQSIPFQRMFEDGTCRVRPGYLQPPHQRGYRQPHRLL